MAHTNIPLSTEIMVKIARTINSEIERSGKIASNNPVVWDNILHKMDNTVWQGLVDLVFELNQQQPKLVSISDLAAFQSAAQLLNRYSDYYERAMDINSKHVESKRTAWRCIMSLREIYCRCVGIDLPNSDASKITTTYGNIFE